MTTEQKTDIKVGGTVLVGLLALFFGIGWAKGIPNPFVTAKAPILARFLTTGGLESGDPVTVNGVKVGTVENIAPDDTGVTVVLSFLKPVDLRDDATASITMLELMGGKKIEVHTGVLPKKLPIGKIIPGDFAGDIGSLVAMVTKLGGSLSSLTVRADTLLGSLNNFMRDNDLKGSIGKTLTDAQQTLEHFNVTAGKVNAMLDENGGALKQTLAQAQVATKDLAEMLREDRPGIRALLDTNGQIMTGARTLLVRATGMFAQIDTLLSDAQHSNTLLYKLAKDKTFGNRIDSLVIHVDKFIEQTRLQGIDANIRFFSGTKPAP